jgi:hypothetical protein
VIIVSILRECVGDRLSEDRFYPCKMRMSSIEFMVACKIGCNNGTTRVWCMMARNQFWPGIAWHHRTTAHLVDWYVYVYRHLMSAATSQLRKVTRCPCGPDVETATLGVAAVVT